MTDPIAEALRPSFARAAKEAREALEGGGTCAVEVLFGHLPRATVNLMYGMGSDGGRLRSFNMSIPSVIGRPDDPDSMLSFVSGMVDVQDAHGMEHAIRFLRSFEKDGPQILANTVRSCIVGLVRAGISHEEISAVANEAVASVVMKS